jgi:hypothetical protein
MVSDLGGMREIVEGAGVGSLFTPGDAISVRRALRTVTEALEEGSLNAFDATRFLGEGDEDLYVRRLLGIYGADAAGDGRESHDGADRPHAAAMPWPGHSTREAGPRA